jgi:hypothetical protein
MSNLTQEEIEALNADRRMVEASCLKTYELYTKAALTIASAVFLGSALSSIPDRANFTILLCSWASMAATLIILLGEMYFSIREAGRYADALVEYTAGNISTPPEAPDNATIDSCIRCSLFTLIMGLLLLLLSVAIPHFSPCGATQAISPSTQQPVRA